MQVRNLIRTNHHGLRVQLRDGVSLGQRQALRQNSWRFAQKRRFVDFGANHVERDAQPGQQFTPVNGRRAQNQLPRQTWGCG